MTNRRLTRPKDLEFSMAMRMNRFWAVGVVAALLGCDSNPEDHLVLPSHEYPGVIEVGQLQVIDAGEFGDADSAGKSQMLHDEGYFGTLGAADIGKVGGATFTFLGTGENVCLFVDPETVYWNQSVSPTAPNPTYAYPDNTSDDGDVDLFAGLSAYYTGSPGVELGTFKGQYTDSLGSSIQIDFQECIQHDYYGDPGAHAGRASIESCTIDTGTHLVGAEYTVVLRSFAFPAYDGAISFGAAVVSGSCGSLHLDECTVQGERPQRDGESDEDYAHVLGLEAAYCQNDMAGYCCCHPELCGDVSTAPDGFCDSLEADAVAAGGELCTD